MPFMRRRRFQRSSNKQVIDSNKNMISLATALPSGVKTALLIAESQDSATLAVPADVERGCVIKAIWIEIWVTATEEIATGITNLVEFYLFKNPGSNLTSPIPGTEGSSNEKSFIFKKWKGIIGSRTVGFPAYAWKGWCKIPKGKQRMAANDVWQLIMQSSGTNALACASFIYKWYK